MTDSAFIYKAQAAQKFAAGGQGGPEFDRMSQRLEKDLGLGNDMDSLMSVERGGADFAQVRRPCLCPHGHDERQRAGQQSGVPCPHSLLSCIVWLCRRVLAVLSPTATLCSILPQHSMVPTWRRGSIFSKDDDMAPEDERWRKRFRRRVKVHLAANDTM